MLLVLPLVTAFDARPIKRLLAGPRDRQLLMSALELAAAFALVGGILWLIVDADFYGSPALFTPVLVWLALRFGACGVATAIVIIVVTAVTAGAYDAWPRPFTPGGSLASRVLPLQLFAVLVAFPTLIVAVLVRQRTQALHRLDGALESMADGFALYDADDRLVIWNRRYQEFLAPVADLLTRGARFGDIVREGARRGIFALKEPAEAEVRIAEILRSQSARRVREVRYGSGRWLQVIPRATAEGGTVLVCRDITERKLFEQTLEHVAMHDPLTDLPNRKLYDRELRRARARAEREGRALALMLLDLDRFKQVNDSYGHQVGDQLLIEVGRRLAACVREGDLVARIGGDEFAVLAEGAPGTAFAQQAERILGCLSERVRIEEIDIYAHASLGFTVFPDDPAELDAFIAHADQALYAAKTAGGRTWRLFEPGMSRGAGASEQIAADVGGALARGEFDLDYQPIVATRSGQLVGIEALLRWNHPRQGRLPAGGFIAIAERTAAIFVLTRFVLRIGPAPAAGLAGVRRRRSAGVGQPRPRLPALGGPDRGRRRRARRRRRSAAPPGARGDRKLVRRIRPRQGTRRAAAPPRRPLRARRFRRELLLARPVARAADGRGQDRPLVRLRSCQQCPRPRAGRGDGAARREPRHDAARRGRRDQRAACHPAPARLRLGARPPVRAADAARGAAGLACGDAAAAGSDRRGPGSDDGGRVSPASAFRRGVGAGAGQPRGWYWLSWYSGICSSCSSVSPDIR